MRWLLSQEAFNIIVWATIIMQVLTIHKLNNCIEDLFKTQKYLFDALMKLKNGQ